MPVFGREKMTAAFDALTGTQRDASARTLKKGEVGNYFRHATALSLSKMADGLVDPKLVLSWLLTSLGAPAVFVGLLVPIREAGALLPQIVISDRIMALRRRRFVWAGGSAVQGLSVLAILMAALTLHGAMAGVAICVALAVLAVARSLCSVSYKDVLGRTVGKARRGSVTGIAGSLASLGVLVFGCFLVLGWADQAVIVSWALALAAVFWLVAAGVFATMRESAARPIAPSGNPLRQFALLRRVPQLRRFVIARGLLVATALAPPYLLLAAGQGATGGIGNLGFLLFAGAGASFVSSYVWGRLSDRSSRRVLMASGVLAALILGLATGLGKFGLMDNALALPFLLFGIQIAYHGVRQGRTTYLVDMAQDDKRAEYTAVANTAVGLILLLGGVLAAGLSVVGPIAVLAVFAVLSLGGVWVAAGLNEVEGLAG